jgi:hypothetical protein
MALASFLFKFSMKFFSVIAKSQKKNYFQLQVGARAQSFFSNPVIPKFW